MKSKKNLNQPLLAELFRKIGKSLGIKVFVEKEWGVVGKLSYPNGIHRYFRGTTLDINTMGASEISRDKDYSKIFMKRMKYPVIPGRKFYSNLWANQINSNQTIIKAWTYAQKSGLPVFIKPNSKSQGEAVTKVHTKKEFYQAFRTAAKIDKVILVEQAITGNDYRIVVLDDKIISAYERIPLHILSDGKSSIKQLIEKKLQEFKKKGREKTFKLDDPRIYATLKRENLTYQLILPKGKYVKLLHNANLSTGGTSIDVTDKVHLFYKEIAVRLTYEMGLRFCGVDFIIEGDITMPSKKWYIIEINSAPGLDHYASIGRKQQNIVEQLYKEVLIAMGKKAI